MINLIQYNPVKVVFGVGTVEKLGEYAPSVGKKPLVVFGKSSAKKSGLDVKVLDLIKQAGLNPVPFYGIEPNPRSTTCDAAVKLAKDNGCDCVIGVGGGSVMDASKAIAASAATGAPVWDLVVRKAEVTSALPLLLVSTFAATGSDFNAGGVITNWETKEKFGMFSPHMYPKVSIIDPALTTTVPKNQTAYGGVDIIVHVMETYLTTDDKDTPIPDYFSEGVARTVVEYLPRALANGDDVVARTQLSWASALALCGLPNGGRPGGFLMHWMEHVMSAHYDIPHGLGLAYLLPPTLEYVKEHFPHRYEKYTKNVLSDTIGFLKSIDCYVTLEDMGIDRNYVTRFVDDFIVQKMVDGKVPANPELTREKIERIYLGNY
ncbi:MAG TPA: iron-containing alcohol dehydrogenase [Caldisericia bacterium]|nr:iron-containing alcohol dehydrogenase [Caldisericia bacterium]HPF48331.1 iron-containing alcohol dehydrogenase [Caldisericia bacterium]HPI83490.1 iron-containing alcohol dehydrogenase [Caldisericia bacterium]HPQ92784.1 iron-containing alcohol dehydrogenase [Caldisericia bacterium]HRV74118.1 iron-containing alcohol dehydrogenase [Caldisericia bacterium]